MLKLVEIRFHEYFMRVIVNHLRCAQVLPLNALLQTLPG